MYINLFWAGTLLVIVVEIVSLFVIGLVNANKKK